MGKHLAQIGGSPEVGNTEGKTPMENPVTITDTLVTA